MNALLFCSFLSTASRCIFSFYSGNWDAFNILCIILLNFLFLILWFQWRRLLYWFLWCYLWLLCTWFVLLFSKQCWRCIFEVLFRIMLFLNLLLELLVKLLHNIIWHRAFRSCHSWWSRRNLFRSWLGRRFGVIFRRHLIIFRIQICVFNYPRMNQNLL